MGISSSVRDGGVIPNLIEVVFQERKALDLPEVGLLTKMLQQAMEDAFAIGRNTLPTGEPVRNRSEIKRMVESVKVIRDELTTWLTCGSGEPFSFEWICSQLNACSGTHVDERAIRSEILAIMDGHRKREGVRGLQCYKSKYKHKIGGRIYNGPTRKFEGRTQGDKRYVN